MKAPRTLIRDRRGSAAVEMALVLPLLLVLMFAGFEAGHYFYTEHKIIKAVREGARYAGRLPFAAAGFSCAATGGPTNWTAMADPGLTQVRNVTVRGTLDATSAPRISGWATSDVDVEYKCDGTVTTGIFATQSSGAPIVRVVAEARYNSLFEQLGVIDSSARVQAAAEAVNNGI